MESEAAADAARERKEPLNVWPQQAQHDLRQIPFLGEFVPSGFRAVGRDELEPFGFHCSHGWRGDEFCFWVDSSGFGGDGRALDYPVFVERVRVLIAATEGKLSLHFGVRQAGQFQVYVGVYVKNGKEASAEWIVREHSGLMGEAPCCDVCGGCSCEEDAHEDYGCEGLEVAWVRVSDGSVFCKECAPDEALNAVKPIAREEYNRWPLG
jgi:hypothetical protein